MMDRCYNPANQAYKDYGGRGIKVCDRWRDIEKFIADLPPGYRLGLEIDRYPNNDGHYEPGNVRWATRQENTSNRRSARLFTHDGKTQSLTAWSKEKGLPKSMILSRINEFGWTVDRALNEPVADKTDNMRRAQLIRWEGHVKKPQPEPRIEKTFLFKGKMRTIRELSEMSGIDVNLLRKRLCERKWPIDKAMK